MPSDWKESSIRHKYDPLPDEPRGRKKSKKRHVKSDHKHDYERVCIDAGDAIYSPGEGKRRFYRIGERCRICGRRGNVWSIGRVTEPPEGMPLYDVGGIEGLFEKVLSDDKRVR